MHEKANPKLTVESVMRALAIERPVFHSEADFQHAFAWELHRRLPNASVRLERPVWGREGAMHLDFLMEAPGQAIAVELKYKTKQMRIDVQGESFETSAHAGQPLGRYDFIKDVWRLEEISRQIPRIEGWAILLTNDSAYWNPTTSQTGIVDEHFRLHEGRVLAGRLDWGSSAKVGTKNKRERAHDLSGTYRLQWSDYSDLAEHRNGRFRYLALEVASVAALPGCGTAAQGVTRTGESSGR